MCPFYEFAPQTYEGALILDAVQSTACLKIGFGSVEGIDRETALTMLSANPKPPSRSIALELLDYAEEGVLAGCAEKRGDGKDPPED